jgi:hypothetical protein
MVKRKFKHSDEMVLNTGGNLPPVINDLKGLTRKTISTFEDIFAGISFNYITN